MNIVNTQMRVIELDINNPADRIKAHAFDKLDDTYQAINEFKQWLDNNLFHALFSKYVEKSDLSDEEVKKVEEDRTAIKSSVISQYVETFRKHGIEV